jgi:hypothetical protein
MARLADAVAGAPILATWHNTNRDRTTVPFVNAAERNTQIPAPTAGMRCYLVTPGVEQIHNGTAWVTTTPVAALIVTQEGTFSTTFADMATPGPSVTVETGTRALITVSSTLDCAPASAPTVAAIGVVVSGATTFGPAEIGTGAITGGPGWGFRYTNTVLLSTLTSGSNTFKLQYRCNSANPYFSQRTIVVQGLP